MKNIADLRKSYEAGELDEHSAASAPLQQFDQWLQQALKAGVPEPNAMTVATVGADGRPSTRIVLIKGYDTRGLVWYTNYDSRKGQELALIEGPVEKVSAEESDAYYASRPLDSRLGAWASPQSQTIPSRTVLVTNAARAAAQHGLHPPRPPHWGGYRLAPQRWEFWQGRKSRLHDRLVYRQDADGLWLRERLAP
ncbi:MAG: hypothetical protein RJB37_860 [Pseudomonadota bacterium]